MARRIGDPTMTTVLNRDCPSIGFLAGSDLKRAAALEDLPIDSLWTGGHIAWRNPTSEPLVSLSRLSAVTSRVRIGTSILPLPLYSPTIVAKQVVDLDRATSGRITLGAANVDDRDRMISCNLCF